MFQSPQYHHSHTSIPKAQNMQPPGDIITESTTQTAIGSQTTLQGTGKEYKYSNADILAHYVVPVLEKGVKSALTEPVSQWTKFRVWYNPYRQVRIHSYLLISNTLLRDPSLALHHCVSRKYYRSGTRFYWLLSLCKQECLCLCLGKHTCSGFRSQ
jgi:hypothetical protein